MHEELLKKSAEIVRQKTALQAEKPEEAYCALGLIDLDGKPTVSTMTFSFANGLEELYHFTGKGSPRAQRLDVNPNACVCFNGPDHNISLSGQMTLCEDMELRKQSWYPAAAMYFSGYDDPNLVLYRLRVEKYNIFLGEENVKGEL